MKKLQDQIKAVTKSLGSLAKQVEKITKQVNKLEATKAKKAPAKKAAAKKAPAKKAAAKKAPAKKAATKKEATVLDSVLSVIKRSKKGAAIAQLKAKTGLDARQLSNALYKLTKKGAIKTASRGVYVSS